MVLIGRMIMKISALRSVMFSNTLKRMFLFVNTWASCRMQAWTWLRARHWLAWDRASMYSICYPKSSARPRHLISYTDQYYRRFNHSKWVWHRALYLILSFSIEIYQRHILDSHGQATIRFAWFSFSQFKVLFYALQFGGFICGWHLILLKLSIFEYYAFSSHYPFLNFTIVIILPVLRFVNPLVSKG